MPGLLLLNQLDGHCHLRVEFLVVMKSLFYFPALVLLSAFIASPVLGQVEGAVLAFDEGNQLYKEGRYEEAIASYERARSLGYTSGLLNYNLGNAYYRSDELGQAIRFYEKAKVYIPESEELAHNLSIAKAQTKDQFSQLPSPAWAVWWENLIAKNGIRTLFFIGLFVYLIAIGLFAHRIRTGTTNPWYRRARSAAAVLTIALLGMAFWGSIQSSQQNRAVVVADEVQLWEAPSGEGEAMMNIHEGLVLDLLQQQGEWAEVRLPNGTRGWVNLSALAEV